MNGATTLWEVLVSVCDVVTGKTDVIDVKTSDNAQGILLDAALEDDVNMHIEFGRRFIHYHLKKIARTLGSLTSLHPYEIRLLL